MKRLMTCFAAVLCTAFASNAAADCVWTGANGFSWNDPGNWEGGAVPNGVDAVASFSVEGAVSVTVGVDVVIGRLVVAPVTAGGKLTLVSEGKVITFSSSGVPEIDVESGAELRVESVALAGNKKVRKAGKGTLAVKGDVAQSLGLDHAAGELRLVPSKRQAVAVSPADGLWTYFRRTSADSYSDHTPYSGTDGIYFGASSGNCQARTVRKSPIPIAGKVRISGTVAMNGTGSWGMALVLHNDSRGADAIADYAASSALGYSGDNKIGKSLAFGFVNYHNDSLNTCKWGVDGDWGASFSCSPVYINTKDGVERVFEIVLELDQEAKTATMTMTQEGAAPFTSTKSNVDLVDICGSDVAYLAFTTAAGGRTTYGSITNLKVEYPDDEEDGAFFSSVDVDSAAVSMAVEGAASGQLASSVTVGNDAKVEVVNGCVNLGAFTLDGSARFSSGVTVVSPSDGEWSHICVTQSGSTNADHTAYSETNGIYFGHTGGNCVTKTARMTPIPVLGIVTITGDVAYQGTGSMLWTIILHNDPRGADAMADYSTSSMGGYAGTGRITNSFAVGFINYRTSVGQYKWGRDGSWGVNKTSDPLIYFNTQDASGSPDNIRRQMKFKLEFDPQEKTATLTLVQNQNGGDVTFTDTCTNVDLRELCGSDRAYVAVTTEAGGRTTYGVIDNLKFVSKPVDGEQAAIAVESMAVSGTPRMALAGVDLALPRGKILPFGLGFDLMDGARFRTVANSVQDIGKDKITVDGTIIPIGVYTSEDCEWIEGEGRVFIGCAGTMLIFK